MTRSIPTLTTLLAGPLALVLPACSGGAGEAGPTTITTTQTTLSPCADGVEGGPVRRVSLDWLGRETSTCPQNACKNNSHPTISYDGIFLAWDSDAEVVAPGPDNPQHIAQVYFLNRQTGELVAVSAAKQPGLQIGDLGDEPSGFATISGSGRFVTYLSDARNLDVDDQDNKTDVYLYSYPDDDNWRITERPDGTGFDGHSQAPDISFEGTVITFASFAKNPEPLVIPGCGQAPAGLLTHSSDVFAYDRNIGHFEWISATGSCEAPNGPSDQPSISYDGRYVAFRSEATNLVSSVGDQDNLGDTQIYVRDRWTGELIPVSVTPFGSMGNGRSAKPQIAGHGRYVVFESDSTDLVPGDTNGKWDIFVRDLELKTTTG